MASAEKKVNLNSLVMGEPVVLADGHPDLQFLRPGQAIIKKTQNIVIKSGSSPLSGYSNGSGNLLLDPPEDPTDPWTPFPDPVVVHKWGPKSEAFPIVLADTPDLSDIESVVFSKYYDAANVLKVKAVIKIKNTSRQKANVIGIDARIYNPEGA